MASGPAASRDRHQQRVNPAPGHTNASAAQPPHTATHLKRVTAEELYEWSFIECDDWKPWDGDERLFNLK